jgi:hypothetical protein
VHGAAGGTLYQPRCNRGELLHGIGVRTADALRVVRAVLAVTPVCRDFRKR